MQTVCTEWTKKSRGAPAARRNATPEQVVLDPTRVLQAEAIWHEVAFREPDFQPRETYRTRSLPNDFLQAAIFDVEPYHRSAHSADHDRAE